MHFLTALQQKVLRTQIFPVDFDNIKQAAVEIIPKAGKYSELKEESEENFLLKTREYLIEPSYQIVLEHLSKHLVEMQFYHLILEANASEHAARRAAMKNASDNAEELSRSLQLAYNKSRQAAITAEITEITAGAESLK
jgi:F-type H+-transporting ATPase subunit gamma